MEHNHTVEFDGRVFTLSYVELIPRHTTEELEALKASIQQHGILDPVKHTPDDVVVDGATRLQLAKELGLSLSDVPLKEVSSESADDLAVQLAFAHRAGTRERRKILVFRLRQLGWSTRRIARAVGVTQPSVINYLNEMPSGDKNLSPERVTGADGKSYSATHPENGGDGEETPETDAEPDHVVDTTDSPPPSNHPDEDKSAPAPKPKPRRPGELDELTLKKRFRVGYNVALNMFIEWGEREAGAGRKNIYDKKAKDAWQLILDRMVGLED